MYDFEEIRSMDEFDKLRDEWDKLIENDTRYRPYFSHMWFKLWLEFFKNDGDIFILTARYKSIIKAIFPFIIKKDRIKDLHVNTIELIGNLASPARNILFSAMDDAEKKKILIDAIEYLGKTKKWDVLKLYSLPEEILQIDMLESSIKETGYRFLRTFGFANWYLDDICYCGEEYIGNRTSNIRRNIKRCINKMERIGEFKILIITEGDNESIDHYMDLYYDLFQKSWKDWEIHPVFHRKLAKLACEKGWLRLGFIMFKGNPIAVQLWLVCERTAYIVRLFYDINFKHMIPGVILSSEMFKYAIDVDKVAEIDCLIGDEEYKKDWAPKRRVRWDIMIFNKNIKGQILSVLLMWMIPIANRNRILKMIKIKISKYLGLS